jgi:hypothetical protein
LLTALLQLRDPCRCRRLGELPREQEVAGVATRDVDDVAAQPNLLDVREENDLHEPA